jgi:ADP-ribosylglycohydrolase
MAAVRSGRRPGESGLSGPEALVRLGGGWVGEEALAIAVTCAIGAPDFHDGVLAAVNHSGDSDSTGAIAGNLLGAIGGTRAPLGTHRRAAALERRNSKRREI